MTMTETLLHALRQDPRRCWWCGCHPPQQPHDTGCQRPPRLSHTWRPVGWEARP